MKAAVLGIVLLAGITLGHGWNVAPASRVIAVSRANTLRLSASSKHDAVFDPLHLAQPAASLSTLPSTPSTPFFLSPPLLGLLATVALTSTAPQPVDAATGTSLPIAADDAIPSAIAAYGHTLGLFIVVACLTTERLTVKANMTPEEEDRLAMTEIIFGTAGFLTPISGYYRLTQYGKGWEFYAHSPIFWVKMTLLLIFFAASLFPTITITKRAVAKQKGEAYPPMSEKLAARLQKVMNGELLALFSIPLFASLMARGVGYSSDFPWQAGAVPCGVIGSGLAFKYVKEALTWQEDEVISADLV